MNKRVMKDAAVLFVITLLAGLILGFVNDLTAGPIAANKVREEQEAYQSVFATADSFLPHDELTGMMKAVNEENAASGQWGKTIINKVQTALDESGMVIGYVFNITNGNTYNDPMELAIGISLDGEVMGVAILESSESPGLGAEASNESFKSQYIGKEVTEFAVVKREPASDAEIAAISGATRTSEAVTYAVNAALDFTRAAAEGKVGIE